MTEMAATCPVEGTRECALREHNIQADNLVTKEACIEKHKVNVWAFSILFGLMSLFLALSGVALANASSASGKIGEVQVEITEKIANSDKSFEVHLARQEESTKALLSTLDAMKKSIDANTAQLNAQSEQIRTQNTILEKMLESHP
jgi:nitrogen fixation/metabolism regulation signal transduction histidine kinase